MKFIVYDRPCLLLEALDLVFALFNELTPESMTGQGSCCIPADEIAAIQATVCAGLDKEDPELQFYFKGIPIETKDQKALTCLAFNLLYYGQRNDIYEVPDAIAALKRNWQNRPKYNYVRRIDMYTIQLEPADSFISLAAEFGNLSVPQAYQLKLADGFSNYAVHVDRLGEILAPIAEALKPLLTPWVEKAAPKREEWRAYLAKEEAMPWLQSVSSLADECIDETRLALRYFEPERGYAYYVTPPLRLHLRMGVGLTPGKKQSREGHPPSDGKYTALRLLTRQECVDIFRATRQKAKCIQDLSHELHMNPGTVFRNVNSMFNVGLLKLDDVSDRNYYLADISRVEDVTSHLVHYLRDE